jgi:2-polyprenyl-6-methoxyphenol hydroxylase-like FAD-dependent oxidoreductase
LELSSVDRAVVVGGSMAGLLAARVLVDHVQEVVLVERDRFPAQADFRAGVPQSRHLHVLLARGAGILERLFPGLASELAANGAVTFRWPRDVLWLGAAGWGLRFERSLSLISSRRELLEWSVRRRVLASPRLRVLQEHEVTALIPGADGAAVGGVRLRARPHGASQDLTARLVVDASGRQSRAPGWLEAIGYAAPRQTVVNSFLGYATRQYAPPDGFRADWQALFLQPRAPFSTRGGGLFPIDGGRWIVTVAGVGRDYPPIDDDGFLDFARSLRSPILYEAIREARPLTPVVAYRRTENQLRHYEQLEHWPAGFIVLGDAVCAFNPIYGQGMTVAAESAELLDDWLGRRSPAHTFQRRLRRVLDTPWLLATGEDYRYPTTEGGRPSPLVRVLHRYVDRVMAVATVDELVALTFLQVLHLLTPPIALLVPRVLARALRGPRRPLLTTPPTRTPLADTVLVPLR